MSLYNDYNTQIFHDEKLSGYRAEAANDRLARIANGARRPWWRRLLDGPRGPQQDQATDWYRYPQVRHHALPVGKRPAVR